MHFQWFPGHMTKAIRNMKDDVRLVDIIIELIDARIPRSSLNPELEELIKDKTKILLLNKKDMADPAITGQWVEHYSELGYFCIDINAKQKKDLKSVAELIDRACDEKRKKDLKRGIKNRPVRAMIVGIPNVGKSTFINSYIGKAGAKTGNRPGVTKGKQWISMKAKNGGTVEFLDTPGVLWPKFEDPLTGLHLALTGSIRDELIISVDLALDLIELLMREHAGCIDEHYNIDADTDPVNVLSQIAVARGCIKKGGEYDLSKAAFFLLDDFRNARLGRFSIECVKEDI